MHAIKKKKEKKIKSKIQGKKKKKEGERRGEEETGIIKTCFRFPSCNDTHVGQ